MLPWGLPAALSFRVCLGPPPGSQLLTVSGPSLISPFALFISVASIDLLHTSVSPFFFTLCLPPHSPVSPLPTLFTSHSLILIGL